MGSSIQELVNAFNLNNYAYNKISTNFTVEGKKIFGLFTSDTNVTRYLQRIRGEIIKRHCVTEEVASRYYNLNYFPFVLNNEEEKYISKDVKKVKFIDSTNNEVIRNLKIHFTNEFERAVMFQVIAHLQKEVGITKEKAHEWIRETVKVRTIDRSSSDLYCIIFSDEYFQKEGYADHSEFLELFKEAYIQEFDSRLKNCGLKSSDFYRYKDGMLYIKDVNDKVIKDITKYVKKEVALDFRTPGKVESKVENFKNVISDLIFDSTGKLVDGYDYDVFTDEKKIKNGNNFALIPVIKVGDDQFESLSRLDCYKINSKLCKNFARDIKGKTAKQSIANCEKPVYAFSNKKIAYLLPKIMEFPIRYNKKSRCFEFAVDLENFRKRYADSGYSSYEGGQEQEFDASRVSSPAYDSSFSDSDSEISELLRRGSTKSNPFGAEGKQGVYGGSLRDYSTPGSSNSTFMDVRVEQQFQGEKKKEKVGVSH